MCPLARELTRRGVTVRVCVSGQHKELLTRALADFGIKPDRNLRVMRAGASLGQLTARILTRTEKLLRRERPDAVLVHGDTTTTLATAMAAFYGRVPLGHVEAGLRTYRMNSPFPEEYNRRTVALTAKWHFVPTEGARANLLREGIANKNSTVPGFMVQPNYFLRLQFAAPACRLGVQVCFNFIHGAILLSFSINVIIAQDILNGYSQIRISVVKSKHL